MNIGHQLCILLEEEGITQKELAEILNLSATTLNGYIKNRSKPDATTLIRLASYFHTTKDFIYGVTSLKEAPTSPYSAEERRLISIYRSIPEDKKSLFIETGKVFSNFGKNKQAERQSLQSRTKNRAELPPQT